jgi:2-aminoethylphosphonate-pyruvate transaminase
MPRAETPTPTAVILAAGLGLRLRSVEAARPKGLIEIGGEALLTRSVRALRAAGVRDFIVVTGWKSEHLAAWAAVACPAARCVENAAFATTGSLASLLIGAAAVPGRDLLIVESDLLYEWRAPRELLAAPAGDTVLVSGFTGNGDEVWVYPDAQGNLRSMSKRADAGAQPLGELVGLTRVSAPAMAALHAAATRLPATAHYEEGLNAIAASRPIALRLLADLVWGEIDDPAHLERARSRVWPRILAADLRPPVPV